MGSGRDLAVAERNDSFPTVIGLFTGVLGVLQRLPGMLRARDVILLSAVLFSAAMRMSRDVVKFRGALVILIMRSVVVTCGHD
jgi:hypothetical protein